MKQLEIPHLIERHHELVAAENERQYLIAVEQKARRKRERNNKKFSEPYNTATTLLREAIATSSPRKHRGHTQKMNLTLESRGGAKLHLTLETRCGQRFSRSDPVKLYGNIKVGLRIQDETGTSEQILGSLHEPHRDTEGFMSDYGFTPAGNLEEEVPITELLREALNIRESQTRSA